MNNENLSSSNLVPKLHIRAYENQDKYAVMDLWEKTNLIRSWNDPELDIIRKLQVQPEWFFVAEKNQQIIASVMAGYDGHRGWINYLAVDPQLQGSGVGRELMQYAEQQLKDFGCPKINLQIRSGNSAVIAFYKSIDYNEDDVVSFGKRLIDD